MQSTTSPRYSSLLSSVTDIFIPDSISWTPMKPPIPSSLISFPTTLSISVALLALAAYLLSIVLVVPSAPLILCVITSMTSPTWFIFSVRVLLEASTSLTALSTTLIFSPRVVASLVIFVTLLLTFDTFSMLTWISSTVCAIASSILCEVCSSLDNACIILSDDVCVPLLRLRIWSATTANPFPASPALAASIEAFNARRLVCDVIPSIVLVSSLTFSNSFLKSSRIFSTLPESSDILLVISTTSVSSLALISACSTEADISCTTLSISSATLPTCSSITLVISIEDSVLSFNTWLLSASVSISFITLLAPALFSSANSLTTVTPSTICLLAPLTCSTVCTTLCSSFSIESVSAPSDSTRCFIAMLVHA